MTDWQSSSSSSVEPNSSSSSSGSESSSSLSSDESEDEEDVQVILEPAICRTTSIQFLHRFLDAIDYIRCHGIIKDDTKDIIPSKDELANDSFQKMELEMRRYLGRSCLRIHPVPIRAVIPRPKVPAMMRPLGGSERQVVHQARSHVGYMSPPSGHFQRCQAIPVITGYSPGRLRPPPGRSSCLDHIQRSREFLKPFREDRRFHRTHYWKLATCEPYPYPEYSFHMFEASRWINVSVFNNCLSSLSLTVYCLHPQQGQA